MINYLPILALFVLAIVFAFGTILLSHLIGPKNSYKEKLSPYECGMPPVGNTKERFPVKFYIVAMLFIVFDIEGVFMIPWAVVFKRLGIFGFIEMAVFIAILLIGLAYVWKKGALEWE